MGRIALRPHHRTQHAIGKKVGTNYYVHTEGPVKCMHCGHTKHGEVEFHLGKQSAGWDFTFHADHTWTPDNAYERWCETLTTGTIADEYGTVYTVAEMIEISETRGNMQHRTYNKALPATQFFVDQSCREWIVGEFC